MHLPCFLSWGCSISGNSHPGRVGQVFGGNTLGLVFLSQPHGSPVCVLTIKLKGKPTMQRSQETLLPAQWQAGLVLHQVIRKPAKSLCFPKCPSGSHFIVYIKGNKSKWFLPFAAGLTAKQPEVVMAHRAIPAGGCSCPASVLGPRRKVGHFQLKETATPLLA